MLHLIAMAAAAITAATPASVQAIKAAPAPLREVTWVDTPTGQDIANVYPPSAVQAGKGGAVLLQCQVAEEGSLEACQVQIEDPVGTPRRVGRDELSAFWDETHGLPDAVSLVPLGITHVIGNEAAFTMQARPVVGGVTYALDIIDLMTFDDEARITTSYRVRVANR